MVPDGLDGLRRSVVGSLESVSSSTEKVYSKMGDTYPTIIRELDASFAQDAGTGNRTGLSEIIGGTLVMIQTNNVQFTDSQRGGNLILDHLDDQLKTLDGLGSCIHSIREDSILMELISLNALVIAVKAGEAGRAFSCITAELKQLTGQTIGLTDQIAGAEGNLVEVFSEFKDDLRSLLFQEEDLLRRFIDQGRKVFEGLQLETDRIVAGLAEIRLKARAVRGPLVTIMVDIQNQDRIRQSIDHVLLSLGEFTGGGSADLRVRLDELSYLEFLPELSAMVLDEIAGQIQDNRNAFHTALGLAKDLVGGLETEGRDFLARHLETTGDGSLESYFHEGERLFSDYLRAMEGLLRLKEKGFRKSTRLQVHVTDLVDSLDSFEAILSKFRNIDLASRIQVARQAALSAMKHNAAEMSDLTRQIQDDVGKASAVTTGFSREVQAFFETYQARFTAQIRQDDALRTNLKDAIEAMKTAKETLVLEVQGRKVFTQAFTDEFRKTEDDLATLDRLLEDIAGQKSHLAAIRTQVTGQKRRLMEENGVREWKVDNTKLKEMIDRFTISNHKKFAAQLGQFEVEDSVDSGDVTLF